MMRSLYAGVSGLRNHQTRMDVIGNNIANVNTIGFKGARVNFQDMLSQTMQSAASSTTNRGGTNPMQVGLGMGMASIDTMFTDGSSQPTGKQTDLAIQGQGFFVLSDGNSQVYTRAGNFDFDTNGNYLVPGSGYKVMGWQADSTGKINTSGTVTSIQVPVGVTMPAKASEKIIFENNLAADAPIGTTVQGAINVFDSLGNSHKVTQIFVKESNNTWLTNATATNGTITDGQMRRVAFTSSGVLEKVEALIPSTVFPTSSLTVPSLQLNSNLNSTDKTNYTVFDSSGTPHIFQMVTTNTANNQWTYQIVNPANPAAAPLSSGTITCNPLTSVYTGLPSSFSYSDGTNTNTVTLTIPTGGHKNPGNAQVVVDTPAGNANLTSLQLANRLNFTDTITLTGTIQDNALPTPTDYVNTTMQVTNTGNNAWSYTLLDGATPLGTGTITYGGAGVYTVSPVTIGLNTINFAVGTSLAPVVPSTINASTAPYTTATLADLAFTPNGAAEDMLINLDVSKLTQYGGTSTLQATDQDGYAAGTLDTTSIDPSGILVGRFTNGKNLNLAQVALATFNNPGGLNKYGNSLFAKSNNSGEPQVGASGSGGRGSFTPGALEMANVDLAQEFSNMIITQRGFQANSKIITTTDSMLEELVNLKR